jgi:hypothetical protein
MLQRQRERLRKNGGRGPSWHGFLSASERAELDAAQAAANEYQRLGLNDQARRKAYLVEPAAAGECAGAVEWLRGG